MQPLGLYIHIPFCIRKCLYCDFVSYPLQEHDVPAYFHAMQREFDWYLQHALWSVYRPYTLYVGGGTPSVVTEELIRWLRSSLNRLPYESFREVTIEVNPGTISFHQFQQLAQAGFTRISIGVQSLHDDELTALGRIHTQADALRCVENARQAGFRNISLDLIFGIPNSMLTTWESSLKTAIALSPEHLSTYNLTIEAGTPFWEQLQQGTLRLPDEDAQLAMYRSGRALLAQAGYEHYEISNFALPGYRCCHNQIYWRNEAYLGLGAGAHSYLNGCRYWNHRDVQTYIASSVLSDPTPQPNHRPYPATVAGEERLTPQAMIGETVMMNLRLLEGLDVNVFQQRFSQSFETVFAKSLDKLRSLNLLAWDGTRVRLTPTGIELSNEVFQEFVNEPHRSDSHKN